MKFTKPLSALLQKGELELISAIKFVNNRTDLMKKWRSGEGSGRFEKVCRDASIILGEVQLPRYNPFLDYIVSDLVTRFQSHNTKAINLCKLLPRQLKRNLPSASDIKDIIEIYQDVIPEVDSVDVQMEM